MLEPMRVLSYLSDAMSFGNGPAVSFADKDSTWSIPLRIVAEGRLGLDLTRAILIAYTRMHPDVAYGERAVPLALSLRTLVATKDTQTPTAYRTPSPVLCIAGLLERDGRILPADDHGAWIPREFVAHGDTGDAMLTVCDVDTYRAHQKAFDSLEPALSWQQAITRALDLFASVDATDAAVLDSLGVHIEDGTCLIRIWERPDDARSVTHILKSMCDEVGELGVEALSAPLRRLLGEELATLPGSTGEETLGDDTLLTYKLRCGMLDYPASLEESDRKAVVACTQQQAGALMRIQTPRGTNGAAFAFAVMANLYTEYALRGEEAPTMACVGTTERLLALMAPYAKRPSYGQVSPLSRWIPRIAGVEGSATGSVEHKVLGALSAPFLLHAGESTPTAPKGTWPTQHFAHYPGSACARYSKPWYLSQASIYYLDCISGFLDHRVRALREAISTLSERLRRIDQARCDLVDAYADVCKAEELVRRRDLIVTKLIGLRHDHKYCRERLEYWSQLAAQYPVRTTIVGSAQVNQYGLIARSAQGKEPLALGKTRISDVCRAYKREIERIESEIDRLRGASATLSHRARAVAPESGHCAELIAQLNGLCRLDATQRGLLESVIDGREVSMAYLDDILDQTVRVVEFWLAVHINEARWLSTCLHSDTAAQLAAEGGQGAWTVWSTFAPFAFVPCDLAASTLSSNACGEHAMQHKRLDLLMVLDADGMDVPTGAALLGLSETAVCMGTQASLGPSNPRGATFDELYGQPDMGIEAWAELGARHLLASGTSSLYGAVDSSVNATRLGLTETYDAYGELCDARVDLMPDEFIRTLRSPANSADDSRYIMAGIMPVLSYVLVPDSAWGQVGTSKENRAEVLALFRWLSNHKDELRGRFPRHGKPPLCLTAPYEAQTRMLSLTLQQHVATGALPSGLAEVHTLAEAATREWPVVMLCGTCGPDTLQADAHAGFEGIISLAVGAATDAFMLVCGGSWLRSDTLAATHFMRRLTRIGRLFSVPHKAKPVAGDRQQTNQGLREKPLSLTLLLQRMQKRGDLAFVPNTADVNRALDQVGLIERTRDERGKLGWRPTAAGREIGIVGTKDRNGNQFCSYGRTAEAVVASIVNSLDRE